MNITFIGGGNMASAILGGLRSKGFSAESLRVIEISPEARARLQQQYGIKCFGHAREAWADRPDDIIVFAVKPQHMHDAAAKSGLTRDANLVITIAAGTTLTTLSRWLGGHARLIRAMPNTPALIGEGITGLYPMLPVRTAQDRQDRECAETILGAVGKTLWLQHEGQMDAVTAISGSGPAYVFYFIEAVEQAAKELGLPAEVGHQLALRTFTGAARLAAASDDAVSVLRERVTSKGGTTERALASMAADHVKAAIVRAIHAANERSRELGAELDRD